MTNRERLLALIDGKVPDCVPVAPDFSNMIPARLTGKPFWDLYLYNDPPIWEAYIDCAKHFDIDSVMDGYFPLQFPEEVDTSGPPWEQFIVFKNDDRIVTRQSYTENGKRIWAETINVYYRDNPPTHGVKPESIGLEGEPKTWEPLEGVKPVDRGTEGLKKMLSQMGDQGLVGVSGLIGTCALNNPDEIYAYYDNPDKHEMWAQERIEKAEARLNRILAMDVKPDFLCVGGSGTLVFQSVDIFRQLALPAVKHVVELAHKAGLPTHVHSCGPETELVKILANETRLTMIDPLEIPPMGDCDLADLKKKYGDKIILKGNLHTTEVMLKGTVDEVIAASKKAIDDAGEGGGFILSTGDQCGRDTPDENLHAMVETARTYGRYS